MTVKDRSKKKKKKVKILDLPSLFPLSGFRTKEGRVSVLGCAGRGSRVAGRREGRASVARTVHSTCPTSRSARTPGAACPAVGLGRSLGAEGTQSKS